MKVTIDSPKVREMFFNGTFYKCNEEIDIPMSEALKLSRIANVKMPRGRQVYNPGLFKAEKEFAFTSDVDMVSGWGNATFNLLKYGAKSLRPALVGRMNGITDPTILAIAKREIKDGMAMVWHEQPKENWYDTVYGRNIAIVPFETTKIPQTWIGRINSFDALIVPCAQNKEAFEKSGVNVPIEIARWGIDEKKIKPLERNNKVFTFGTHGALSTRKGTDLLVEAFLRAFPNKENVKLICKTSYNGYPFMTKDKRVQVIMTPIDHDDLMREYFQKIDVGVYPTRGEGFGLCPLEVMATGAPVIVTGWSGPLEYMTTDVGWLINHTMVPAKDFTEQVYKEDCGDWAEPDINHLVELMRYAYEHQDEVKEKGRNALKHVQESWTWDLKIQEFVSALEKHL